MRRGFSDPKISVIIPTYNCAAFLREALQSVVIQSEPAWEAIVINNFSSDDTIEVVESFHDARIILINFHNRGIIGAARNRGVQEARSEVIAFLDSDDLWLPEKIERSLEALTDDVDVVHHGIRLLSGTRLGRSMLLQEGFSCNLRRLLLEQNYLYTSTVVVRKSCFLEAGGFSELDELVTAEDWDLWIKLAKASCRFFYIRECYTKYRIHTSSASRNCLRHLAAQLAILRSYYPLLMPVRPLDGFRRRRVYSYMHYGAGRGFQKSGDDVNGVRYFLTALGYDPTNYRALIATLWSGTRLIFRKAIGHIAVLVLVLLT